MNADRFGQLALVALMAVVAALGWWMQLRPALAVDASALSVLPLKMGDWRGEPVALMDTVERMLEADFNLQRVYHKDDEPQVWLYVGYYGTQRGGRPEHTPDECYPSAGWRIESREVAVIDEARGLRANEFIVNQMGEQRVVHFWYQSARSPGLLGTLDISLDHLQGRLDGGRADGSLVRISTPLAAGDLDGARDRLERFALLLEPLLVAHWPRETPIE